MHLQECFFWDLRRHLYCFQGKLFFVNVALLISFFVNLLRSARRAIFRFSWDCCLQRLLIISFIGCLVEILNFSFEFKLFIVRQQVYKKDRKSFILFHYSTTIASWVPSKINKYIKTIPNTTK